MLLLPRTLLHPVMLMSVKLLRCLRRQKFVFFNTIPHIKTNAIFTVNHSCSLDIPVSCEVIGTHAIVLVGTQELQPLDRAFFNLNGTIWVDRHRKASKAAARKSMLEVLRRGKSLLVFPEGTWNLSPNALHLPLYWGVIDIARESGKPIIPMCLEYIGRDIVVSFSAPISVGSEDGKQEKFEDLSAAFSTMKYDIFEQRCKCTRKNVSEEDWDAHVVGSVKAYPCLDIGYEKSVIRKTHTAPEEAFAHLSRLIPCRENAFLFGKR